MSVWVLWGGRKTWIAVSGQKKQGFRPKAILDIIKNAYKHSSLNNDLLASFKTSTADSRSLL